MLQNEHLLADIGFYTAEDEPSKTWAQHLASLPRSATKFDPIRPDLLGVPRLLRGLPRLDRVLERPVLGDLRLPPGGGLRGRAFGARLLA